MIKLDESRITDLLPRHVSEDPQVQAFSYAIYMEKKRLMELADKTRTHAYIDQLPEDILDILAVELRAPYYEQGMELEVKRKIIKNTLIWHTKAGTPAAVQELIEAAFGSGRVEEWFDFTEPPFTRGTFDIITSEQMTSGMLQYFFSVVRRVKNTRSHLRRIVVRRELEGEWYVGAASFQTPREKIVGQRIVQIGMETEIHAGAAILSAPHIRIVGLHEEKEVRLSGAEAAGTHSRAIRRLRISGAIPETQIKSRPIEAVAGHTMAMRYTRIAGALDEDSSVGSD